jgi:hypothetical protein
MPCTYTYTEVPWQADPIEREIVEEAVPPAGGVSIEGVKVAVAQEGKLNQTETVADPV